MQMTAKEIIKATGGRQIAGSPGLCFTRISTDSRTLRAGDFYVPLKGPRFDGHDYLDEAFSKGAGGCLLQKSGNTKGPCIIEVKDTLRGLGDVARAWRDQFKIPMVAVTGSSGKTATKEMIACSLSPVGTVSKTEGNLNNLIGLPQSLLNLKEGDRFGVFELGMNALGEIARLTEIVAPTIGLITNVGPAHLEGLGDLEGVARAKGELFDGLGTRETAVVNLEDPYVARMKTRARVLTFGFSPKADIRCTGVHEEKQQTVITIEDPKGRRVFHLPTGGEHQVKNWVACYAVCFALGISPEQAEEGIQKFRVGKGRGEMISLRDSIVVIDDTYNANPDSMKAALNFLVRHFIKKKKVAVLGEMLELGDTSPRWHRELGKEAARLGVDFLLAYGEQASQIVSGFTDEKSSGRAFAFDDLDELNRSLVSKVNGGEAILVKGSRGAHMERVVDFLIQRLT